MTLTIKNIIDNGGATINYKGEAVLLKSGYQVGCKSLGRVAVKDFTLNDLSAIVSYGLKRGKYAGLWVDNGFVYCDISERIATKCEALKIGAERGELSILNWKTMECLPC